jgi:RND family efflux transporter MFP subunit
MNSPALLLSQLRIDRPDDPKPAAGHWNPRWLMAATISALVAGAVTWWILARSDDGPVLAHTGQLAQVPPQVGAKAILASAGTAALDTSGYVVARRQATVSSKATGRLAEILIEEGQRVEKGQIIARLDSSSTAAALEGAVARLAQAQADLEAARVASDDAYPIYRRNEQQHAAGLISSQAFDGAKAVYNATRASHTVKETAVAVSRAQLALAQRNHEDMVIRAPFAGIVTVKAAQPGEIVSPLSASSGFARTGIGTIVDMVSLEAEVDVSENFIARVRLGQAAIVRLNAYPDWEIPAETVAVIPTADRSKATVKVRVGFKQKDPRILPDMGVKVTFLSD